MKKIIPILSAISLLSALICSILLVQSDWSFSVLFKSMLLFISAFIGLIAFWKSSFNKYILLIAGICFGSLALILLNTKLYTNLWNIILAGHVLLVGYSLYMETRSTHPSIFQNITKITVIISMPAFIIVILLKLQDQWIYTGLFTLLSVMSTSLITNKLISISKRKK